MLPPGYLTAPDRDALAGLVRSRPSGDAPRAGRRPGRLDGAVVLPPGEIPADVVTMDSVVRLTDLEAGTRGTYTLVYPGRADFRAGRLSVLAPVGTALLGRREGDVVEGAGPAGPRRFRIDAVVYQPEADGPAAR